MSQSQESEGAASAAKNLKGLVLGIAALVALIYLPGKVFGGNAMAYMVEAIPILVGGFAVWLFIQATPRLRTAVCLAWAFPGLGHFYIGERRRGLVFAIALPTFFLVGLALSQWAAVSPFDRHPVWGYSQYPGGLMFLVTWLATLDVKVLSPTDTYLIGSVYVGSACLLNLLAMCDVRDLVVAATAEEKDSAPAKEETA